MNIFIGIAALLILLCWGVGCGLLIYAGIFWRGGRIVYHNGWATRNDNTSMSKGWRS